MAKVVCTRCGHTGYSKNPHTRSVFPDHVSKGELGLIDGLFSWIVGFHDPISNDLSIPTTLMTFKCFFTDEEASATGEALEIAKTNARAARLIMFRDCFAGLSDQQLRVLACDHNWEFAPGEHSDI